MRPVILAVSAPNTKTSSVTPIVYQIVLGMSKSQLFTKLKGPLSFEKLKWL